MKLRGMADLFPTVRESLRFVFPGVLLPLQVITSRQQNSSLLNSFIRPQSCFVIVGAALTIYQQLS